MRRELLRYLLYTCLIMFMSFLVANAQPSYIWARQFSGAQNIMPAAIAMDDSGNVYTTGTFEGQADFDPGSGTFTLSAQSAVDVFVCKLNANGNFVWCRQISGGGAVSSSIAVDPLKNVYVVGQFNGTTDFDPDAGTLYNLSVTAPSAFALKLNASGTFAWAKKFGGAAGFTNAASVTVNKSSVVWITGYFSDTADFDPGASDSLMIASGPRDVFVCRLGSTGDFEWAVKMGGEGLDAGADITTDQSENVFITGGFQSTADFDPGSATQNLTAAGGPLDVFVCKLDKGGKYLWAKNIGGAGSDAGLSLSVDNCGNVYTTGLFEGTSDFDPAEAKFEMTAAGLTDVFISKLSSSGAFKWARKIGGAEADAGIAIMVDISGDIYTAGRFMNAVDFDPGNGTTTLTSAGAEDVFVMKVNALGEFLCAGRMGGQGTDVLGGMVVNPKDHVFSAGYFSVTADFDPTPADGELTSDGAYDGFVSRLGPGSCCRQIDDPLDAIASGMSLCMGESTKLNVVPTETETCPTWYWYAESCGGAAVASGDTVVMTPTSTTTYYVRAEGACDTTICKQVTVIVKPKPTAYFEPQIELRCEGIHVELKNYSSNADMYMWEFTDGQISFMNNPKHDFEYDEPVAITLTATHSSGCKDKYTWSNHFYSFKYQFELDIPNIFSPNGDGVNDEFYIKYGGKGMIEECYTLTIFDRWGGIIFTTQDPKARWNGKTTLGSAAKPGTYFYTIEIQEEKFNGYIMLME